MTDRTHEVRNRVDSVRVATIQQRRIITFAVVATSALLPAVLIATFDFFWMLSFPARAAALILAGSLLVYGLVSWRKARPGYFVQDAAADVEAEFGEYGQQLRTTLDYADENVATAPASPDLVEALSERTVARVERDDFSAVVKTWPSVVAVAGMAVAAAFALALLLMVPEGWITAGRTVLLPLNYRSLTVETVDAKISAGEDVVITAEISGRPVTAVTLYYRPASSNDEWSEVPLEPEAAGEEGGVVGTVRGTLADCEESLDFRVVADDLQSRVYAVTVLQPLVMEEFAAEVVPPAYTQLEAEKFAEPNLKVIEGSAIQLELQLNRAAEAASLDIAENGKAVANPPSVQIQGETLRADLGAVTQTQQLVVTARSQDGVAFQQRLRIQVRPDGKPKIRFVRPPEELEVTPTTEVPLAVQVNDDFGVNKVGIMAQVGNEEMRTLWEEEYDETEKPKEAKARPVLFLENHELTFQDAVTYYAFVEDNRPGESRRVTTELRFIDIRPYKREYQILEGGGT